MFPELDSMTIAPGLIAPVSMPCLMMFKAGLSLVLPPGLSDSNLAHTRNPVPAKIRLNLTSGVRPMAARIPSFMMLITLRKTVCELNDQVAIGVDRKVPNQLDQEVR